MRHFRLSILLTILSIIGMGLWGYHSGGFDVAIKSIFTTLLLIFLEISFSFDNAVAKCFHIEELE